LSETPWVKPAAMSGALGAGLMFAGDLLFFAHWEEMPIVSERIEELLAARRSLLLATTGDLRVSGILGPLSALLYMGGAWHLYARLRSSPRPAIAVGCLSAIGFALSGGYHLLWALYGTLLQFGNEHSAIPAELLLEAAATMAFVNEAVSLPLGLAMLALTLLIVTGRSDYPKWFGLFTPLLPLAVGPTFLEPIAATLDTPYGAFFTGAYYNAIMAIFFVFSGLVPRRGVGSMPPKPKTAGS